MKTFTLSLVALMALGFGASAQETVPSKIYVMGAAQSTINGHPGTWTIKDAIPVDVVDGTATINITNAVGAYHIFTCTLEEAIAADWKGDGLTQTSKIGVPSTVIADYGVVQDVAKKADTNFTNKSGEYNYSSGNVTIKFTDNLTKATILPTTLFCVGGPSVQNGPQPTINGTEVDWTFEDTQAKNLKVEAADGCFTLKTDWVGPIFVSPYYAGNVWGNGVIGKEYESINSRKTMSPYNLNKEMETVINGVNLVPPFLSATPYTIVISQDLKTIEYKVANRNFQIEVGTSPYDANPEVYDMNTKDGVTYTYTFNTPVNAGSTITIVNKNKWTNSVWRKNGTITLDQAEGWITSGGPTESKLDVDFTGVVVAKMPLVMVWWNTIDGQDGNKYWAENPNAQVLFSKDTSAALTVVENEDAAPAEYFNLQGVRVENPEKGIFIKRCGSKVSKVILK